MIFDKDFSFLRLRDNFEDAKNLGESPQASICYNHQIRLAKGETYFQITNSPTDISFNDNYEVHFVDQCDNVVEDITNNIFIEEFYDDASIKQLAWEYVCNSEHYFKPLSIRFTNTVNFDRYYTNLINVTELDKHLTTRFVYKHCSKHYGTQYNKADYYQAIRLSTYYRQPVNEDTRDEYNEVTTNTTIGQRNFKKRKRRYTLYDIDNWTAERIDTMVISNEVYVDNWKMTNTSPIEFIEPEAESNINEGELLLNPDFNYRTYEYEYQLFDGLSVTEYLPFGANTTSSIEAEGKARFNITPTLGEGSLTLYDASDNSVVETFANNQLSIQDNDLYIATLDADQLPNGSYYIQFPSGLVTALGIEFEGINDTTTWAFTIQEGDFNNSDFNSTDFLTD